MPSLVFNFIRRHKTVVGEKKNYLCRPNENISKLSGWIMYLESNFQCHMKHGFFSRPNHLVCPSNREA